MTVTKLSNGQYEVKHKTHYELVSQYDERFKDLYIALHNFKNNQL